MSDRHIPLSVPSIQGNEWTYIKECLDTEWVSSAGKYVNIFEKKISDYTGAKHAVAVVNGTAALHVSLIVAGIVPGDEVIVPTLTFIAPVNAVVYAGARPVFMDCDEFYNIGAAKTIEFITEKTEYRDGHSYNKGSGRRVAAIIPVHIFGHAVGMDELSSVCRERNIKIIEDATESLGSRYTQGSFAGRHTGTVGDLGCYSFNGNKIITTGGGGMIVTDNGEYAERARYLSTQAKDDPVRYIHGAVGYNYRLTDIHSALGVSQLHKLDGFIERRREIAASYSTAFGDSPFFDVPVEKSYAKSSWHLYPIRLKDEFKHKKTMVFERLRQRGLGVQVHYIPVHLQPYYQHLGYKQGLCPNAEDFYQKEISLPLYPSMADGDIEYTIETVISVFREI